MRTGGRIGRGLLMGLVAIIVFVVSNNPALGLTGTQSMPTARVILAVGVVDNILYRIFTLKRPNKRYHSYEKWQQTRIT